MPIRAILIAIAWAILFVLAGFFVIFILDQIRIIPGQMRPWIDALVWICVLIATVGVVFPQSRSWIK